MPKDVSWSPDVTPKEPDSVHENANGLETIASTGPPFTSSCCYEKIGGLCVLISIPDLGNSGVGITTIFCQSSLPAVKVRSPFDHHHASPFYRSFSPDSLLRSPELLVGSLGEPKLPQAVLQLSVPLSLPIR